LSRDRDSDVSIVIINKVRDNSIINNINIITIIISGKI
jgi:hypothetical protein